MDSEPGKIHQIHLNDIVWSGMMPAASDLHHNVSNCRLGVAWAQMQDLAKWIVPTLQYKGCWTWQIFPGLVMFSLLASACRAWLSDPLCENRKPHCPLSIITRPYIILGHIGYNSYILRPYLTFSESPRFPDVNAEVSTQSFFNELRPIAQRCLIELADAVIFRQNIPSTSRYCRRVDWARWRRRHWAQIGPNKYGCLTFMNVPTFSLVAAFSCNMTLSS